jgi:hypothetical protein
MTDEVCMLVGINFPLILIHRIKKLNNLFRHRAAFGLFKGGEGGVPFGNGRRFNHFLNIHDINPMPVEPFVWV